MVKKGNRGGTPRFRKEEKAGCDPEQGTGALGGYMPHPTGRILKQAFGGEKTNSEMEAEDDG